MEEINNYFEMNDDKIKGSDIISKDELKKEETKKEIVLGIDLGTTNCCFGIWDGDKYVNVKDEYSNSTMPNYLSLTERSTYLGRDAKNQTELNPLNTIYEIKRLIGRKITDPFVEKFKNYLPYKISGDENDNVIIEFELNNLRKNKYTVEELTSKILSRIKNLAEEQLGEEITKAVITVPAYFGDSQRQATKDSATIAGLECVSILNEPTAAALAYGLEKKSIYKDKESYILVYDMGGGTLDCSLLYLYNGFFRVIGTSGNSNLGGSDFDSRIMEHCLKTFSEQNNLRDEMLIDRVSMQKLKKICETAKKKLSNSENATIKVNNFYNNTNLKVEITKDIFEKMCKDLFKHCLRPINDLLKNEEIEECRHLIDEIILVGGTTRIPKIKENIRRYLNINDCDKIIINDTIDPDKVVSIGASIRGFVLENDEDPFSENITLLDVMPLSLGVETMGGIMTIILPRNTSIPSKKTKIFTPDNDFETEVNIKIFEGERKLTKNNMLVGEFLFGGLDEGPKGYSKISITMNVDANGIVSMTTVDVRKNENKKTIEVKTNKGRLTSDEIKNLIKESRENEELDKINRMKKEYHFKIRDLCNVMMTNIDNENLSLPENEKNELLKEAKNIIKWLDDKTFADRRKKEYKNMIKKINSKYYVFTLSLNKNGKCDENIVSESLKRNKNQTFTSVFDDDSDVDDDNHICDDDDDLLNHKGVNVRNKVKKEKNKLKNDLLEKLYNINNLVDKNFQGKLKINFTKDAKEEILMEVNDDILWVHVKDKIEIDELNRKIKYYDEMLIKLYDKYYDEKIEESDSEKLLEDLKNMKEDEYNKYFAKVNVFKGNLEELCINLQVFLKGKKLNNNICELTLDYEIDASKGTNITNLISDEMKNEIQNEETEELMKEEEELINMTNDILDWIINVEISDEYLNMEEVCNFEKKDALDNFSDLKKELYLILKEMTIIKNKLDNKCEEIYEKLSIFNK